MPQAHDSTTPQDKSDILQCPACLKFFSSGKGLNSHLSMARSCQWYRKGKNRELVDFTDHQLDDTEDSFPFNLSPDDSTPENPTDDWNSDLCPPPFADDDSESIDLDHDDFVLLPQAGPGPTTTANRQSGRSQPSIVLDDNDDTRYVIEHPTAGKVFSSADKDGDITMEDNTVPNNPYAPFSSEMDWMIAQWAVKDAPGHKAFDRFLEIPGVSLLVPSRIVTSYLSL